MNDTDNRLLHVLRNIVCRTPMFANEIDVFDLESRRIWEGFSSGVSPAWAFPDVRDEDFEFGNIPLGSLWIVPLLWGTYRTAGYARSQTAEHASSREALREDLQRAWAFHLAQAGLSQDLAAEIVMEHGPAAAEILHQSSNSHPDRP